MFENPRRGGQARNFPTNIPKILDLKSSSEQIFSKTCRWVPLGFDFVETQTFSVGPPPPQLLPFFSCTVVMLVLLRALPSPSQAIRV